MIGGPAPPNGRVADNPDHCRSGSLESPHQSVEPGCGFVEAFEHVDLAVLADNGESVAVRMKAVAPARMESGGGSSVASCFSTPDLTSIETSR
jgi:hypothetical protein